MQFGRFPVAGATGAILAHGVRQGDLITVVRLADEAVEVDGPDSLQAALDRFGPVAALELGIVRGVDPIELTVTFAD